MFLEPLRNISCMNFIKTEPINHNIWYYEKAQNGVLKHKEHKIKLLYSFRMSEKIHYPNYWSKGIFFIWWNSFVIKYCLWAFWQKWPKQWWLCKSTKWPKQWWLRKSTSRNWHEFYPAIKCRTTWLCMHGVQCTACNYTMLGICVCLGNKPN